MVRSRLARNAGRLAVTAVVSGAAIVPLGGIAFAGTSYGTGPAVNCTVSYSNGTVTVSSTGFGPGATYSYSGTNSGTGSGSTYSVTGLPAGSTFSSTVMQGSGATYQTCTASFTVGGGTPPTTIITGPSSPVVSGGAGGGGGSTATTPVAFTAPVSVAGTTTSAGVTSSVPVKVLGKSLTKHAAAVSGAKSSKTSGAVSQPSGGLAFTGSDDVVGGTILGLSLVAGGAGFVAASRKRSRRRARNRTA